MTVSLVEVRHGQCEPTVDSDFLFVIGSIRVHLSGSLETGLHVVAFKVKPVFGGHIFKQIVVRTAMVEDHVHYDFQPFGISFLSKFAELFVTAEAAVYLIIIGNGITVIRSFFHVIFLNRVEPYTGDSEVCYVIQMILYSFQVAAMTCERLITVYISFQHSGNDVVGGVAIGETVRHNEIKHVARIKTFYCRSIRPALFKLVRDFCLLFALFQDDVKVLWSSLRKV